jgi:DNA replication protein DnaC
MNMLLAQTNEKLAQMNLFGMQESLKTRLGRTDHSEMGFTELFGLVVDDEWMSRENKKLAKRFKTAKFKEQNACIENLEYSASRGLKKDQTAELAQNRWITAHQNIFVTGQAGAGKSYLAQALGNHACRQGITVQYIRIPKLMFAFVQARADGSYGNLLARLARINLLILDDFGLSPLTDIEKQDLVEVAEDRYGVGSTIVTSQLPVNTWHEYLGAGRIADALLERWIHNAHRFDLKSRDSRRRDPAGLLDCGQSGK